MSDVRSLKTPPARVMTRPATGVGVDGVCSFVTEGGGCVVSAMLVVVGVDVPVPDDGAEPTGAGAAPLIPDVAVEGATVEVEPVTVFVPVRPPDGSPVTVSWEGRPDIFPSSTAISDVSGVGAGAGVITAGSAAGLLDACGVVV